MGEVRGTGCNRAPRRAPTIDRMARDPLTPRADPRRRITLPVADVSVDPVTEDETVELIVSSALAGEGGLVVTPNVDHLHQISRGSWLGSVYADADLVVADGMPLIWASRLMGQALPERVAGSHLLGRISEAAAASGLPIYIVGGRPGAAEEVVRRYRRTWPDLKVAGTLCPPMGFERRPGAIDEICAEVAAAVPAIVFTALGAPKQDYLNQLMHRRFPQAWYVGVGAAVDMAAGHVERAPVWAQRSGLEWAFRLAQEPGRMAKRYLVDDAPFALRLLAASARNGRARGRSRTP